MLKFSTPATAQKWFLIINPFYPKVFLSSPWFINLYPSIKGAYFIKHHKYGAPKLRHVSMDPELTKVFWREPNQFNQKDSFKGFIEVKVFFSYFDKRWDKINIGYCFCDFRTKIFQRVNEKAARFIYFEDLQVNSF